MRRIPWKCFDSWLDRLCCALTARMDRPSPFSTWTAGFPSSLPPWFLIDPMQAAILVSPFGIEGGRCRDDSFEAVCIHPAVL